MAATAGPIISSSPQEGAWDPLPVSRTVYAPPGQFEGHEKSTFESLMRPYTFGNRQAVLQVAQSYGIKPDVISPLLQVLESDSSGGDRTMAMNQFCALVLGQVFYSGESTWIWLLKQLLQSAWQTKVLPLNTDPQLADVWTFTWTLFEFADATPLIQPYQSSSRVFGGSWRTHTVSKQRFGRALEMPLDAVLTRNGYKMMGDAIMWMAACTDMLIARLVVEELMRCRMYGVPRGCTTHQNYIDYLRSTAAGMYIVQKSEAPIHSAFLIATREMLYTINTTPTEVIMSDQTYMKAANTDKMLQFGVTGKELTFANRDGNTMTQLPVGFASPALSVHQVHNAQQRPQHMLEQMSAWGCYTMLGLHPDIWNARIDPSCIGPGLFGVDMMMFGIGDYVRLNYTNMLNACILFDKDGKVMPNTGPQIPELIKTHPNYAANDPFMVKGRPIAYHGELLLKDPALFCVVASKAISAYCEHSPERRQKIREAFDAWDIHVKRCSTMSAESIANAINQHSPNPATGIPSRNGMVDDEYAQILDNYPVLSFVQLQSLSMLEIRVKCRVVEAAKAFYPVFVGLAEFMTNVWTPPIANLEFTPPELAKHTSMYAAVYHSLYLEDGAHSYTQVFLGKAAANQPNTYGRALVSQLTKALQAFYSTESRYRAYLDGIEAIVSDANYAAGSHLANEVVRFLVAGWTQLKTLGVAETVATEMLTSIIASNARLATSEGGDMFAAKFYKLGMYYAEMRKVLLQQKVNIKSFEDRIADASNPAPVTPSYADAPITADYVPVCFSSTKASDVAAKLTDYYVQDPDVPALFIPKGDAAPASPTTLVGAFQRGAMLLPFQSTGQQLGTEWKNLWTQHITNTTMSYAKWNADAAKFENALPGAPNLQNVNRLVEQLNGLAITDATKALLGTFNKKMDDQTSSSTATAESIKQAKLALLVDPGTQIETALNDSTRQGEVAEISGRRRQRMMVGDSQNTRPWPMLSAPQQVSFKPYQRFGEVQIGSRASSYYAHGALTQERAQIKATERASPPSKISEFVALVNSERYMNNYKHIAGCANSETRMMFAALLNAPYTRQVLEQSAIRGVFPMLNMMAAQPLIVDLADALIYMIGGKNTGMTRVDHLNLQFGIDTETKTVKAHLTVCIAAVVGKQENVCVIPHADFKRNLGGATNSIIEVPQQLHTQDMSQRKSLLIIPIDPSDWCLMPENDVTGCFPYPVTVPLEQRVLLHSSGMRVSSQFSIRTLGHPNVNSVVFQDTARRMDPCTGKWTIQEKGHGPWGPLLTPELRTQLDSCVIFAKAR